MGDWIMAESAVELPILMYQSISEGNGLRVPSEEFRSPDETFLVLTENRMPSEKCVWLTFDGGYTGSNTEAFPILKENGMKATVFMIGKSIDKGHHLTENQMLEMSRKGFRVKAILSTF
ncbi:polysaccharide deacetylase family protein [Peribacillus simplex]|uniref:polysaccharide deacetylase family protein n=1 Tax=Peribacillus simplex TaxID=1478 RepID=UPI003D2B9371